MQIVRNMGFILGVLGFMVTEVQALDLEKCDALYAARQWGGTAETLMQAEACYRQALATAPETQKNEIFERAMINLSAVVNLFAKSPSERPAINAAFEWLELFKPATEKTAEYKYWYAVWVSFDAMALDRGAVLPRHLFRNLKFIQTQLRHAMELKPEIHLHGPHRVLGLMHSQMPGIVGGDKVLAERLLREATTLAPAMSANWVGYATILNINGKYEEAKKVLKEFLAVSPASLEPYSSAPLRSLKVETEQDVLKARELLKEIESYGSY